jgi:hypothetical protein
MRLRCFKIAHSTRMRGDLLRNYTPKIMPDTMHAMPSSPSFNSNFIVTVAMIRSPESTDGRIHDAIRRRD